MRSPPEARRHKPPAWLRPAGFVGLGLAVLIVLVGLVSRGLAGQDLKRRTLADAVPTVDVVRAGDAKSGEGLLLPGQVQAHDNAVIHARVSGYLKRWYVDIGAQVKAGQTLAEIDTPELDEQLAQAKSNLGAASANQALAKTTADRWANLLARDAVSKQEAEEKAGDLAAKTAVAQAARAEMQRLQALQSFKRLTAPFAGVVTARNTDIGQLIAAGNPNDPGLFTVADVRSLRVYVHIPQAFSSQIKLGAGAVLTVPEYPGRTFKAKLTTTSGAVGAGSGAILAELELDNADNALKPGEFTQVKFATQPIAGVVRVPASALLFRQEGMMVAVVGANNRVSLRLVKIQRDLGVSVELAGVTASDRIVNNPPDSLADGEQVRLGPPPAAPKAEG